MLILLRYGKYENKSKLSIAVILMIITLGSISFAAFFISRNQTNDNKMLSGCFDTSFVQNSTFMTAYQSSSYKSMIDANPHWSKFINLLNI